MKIKLEKDELNALKEVKTAFENLQTKVERAKAYGLEVEFDTAEELYIRNVVCNKILSQEEIEESINTG